MDWLLAHDTIGVPATLPAATLAVAGSRGRARTVRLDDPWLVLADDVEEERLAGWCTEEDADALAGPAGEFGESVQRRQRPGTVPLAVRGEVE
ncbi:hypothetical protein [Streptomyces sp. NBC_01546]|uniref:hypothetical protein n=2 Tax=unclassified Streptomyces TaxID=2593676 RepID=UPI003870EA28